MEYLDFKDFYFMRDKERGENYKYLSDEDKSYVRIHMDIKYSFYTDEDLDRALERYGNVERLKAITFNERGRAKPKEEMRVVMQQILDEIIANKDSEPNFERRVAEIKRDIELGYIE